MNQSLSLREFADRVTDAVNTPAALKNQWVRAELYDLSVHGGHCYTDLVQKDPSSGQIVARMRAMIWRQVWTGLAPRFAQATGQQLRTGLNVLLLVSARHSPQYGLSVEVHDIDPSFTLGAKEMLRRERLARLQHEGIMEMNRQLPRPVPLQRIAIISGRQAAGYGDFINQLYNNPRHLRFDCSLYSALMQGDRCPQSIISALDQVWADAEHCGWQAVAIIRGGGGTSDLDAYDDYDLAATVAQFPLPVIIGIGHERDVTLLDYVANARLKTPTAVAEWLVAEGTRQLDRLQSVAATIFQTVTERLDGDRQQLSFMSAKLPGLARQALDQARLRQVHLAADINAAATRRITSQQRRLDAICNTLQTAPQRLIENAAMRLQGLEQLLDALSPRSTLARGYSITRGPDGRALRSASGVPAGTVITTVLSDGSLTSTVNA